MANIEPYGEPGRAAAVDGEVVLNGPGNVGVSMTLEAAEETAKQLLTAVDGARKQRAQASAGNPRPMASP
jgi:hypothetical protein